jgi:molecular chaperone GrpE
MVVHDAEVVRKADVSPPLGHELAYPHQDIHSQQEEKERRCPVGPTSEPDDDEHGGKEEEHERRQALGRCNQNRPLGRAAACATIFMPIQVGRVVKPGNAPADVPDAEPAPAVVDLEVQLADLREKWLRSRADYDNLQRRVARDSALERDRAKARVLEGFLPIFELAQMAAHQAEAHPGPVSEGVVLMAREFERLLQREGLSKIGASGDVFDASCHEAVGEEAVDGVGAGRVSRVVLPGYRLGDKVLRYAKVLVQPK